MQESLFNTVQKLQSEQKINVEELEVILNSDIEEVVTLCKKACLKPKTDNMGNAYFTRNDVDILKKMKELYSQSNEIQQKQIIQKNTIEEADKEEIEIDNPNKKINFLTRAKNRIKSDTTVSNFPTTHPIMHIQERFDKLENSLITKMSDILSEKMDGFDEIIVELIRSKTENENLRQQINSLNKQVFILKKELASYSPLPFGLYAKKDTDEM